MSATTPDFLSALGIDAQATDRDVRRAYARRLKAIDHETEVEAFHALREHYQSALQWVAERDRQGVRQDPAPEAAPAPAQEADFGASSEQDVPVDHIANTVAVPAPLDAIEASDDPDQAVFDEFNAKLSAEVDSEASAEAALTAALRDPRLASIDAPARFEMRVAILLANGWQPGHQFLLLPAIRVFDWQRDFRRLETLGQVGEFLHAAIMQRDYFFALSRDVFEVYAEIVRRLRDGKDPSRRLLMEDMSKLRILTAQFPDWLHVVTSMENVRRWYALFDASPEAKRWEKEGRPVGVLYAAPAEVPRRRFAAGGWLIALLVLALPSLKSCIDGL
ncbi:hypothetical protein [Roseateles sp. L2-2]|uniref:hypothetical protein n=1 Tax=Roseateles sp. L2-2 TaxID=3422597 RepID=UPI003D364D26